MLLRLIVLVALLFSSNTVPAQFFVKHNDVEINYTSANIKYAFLQTVIFNDSTLKGIEPNTWKNLTNTTIPISYVGYTTWLKIPIKSLLAYGNVEYLNINNPHINYLKCWITNNDSIVKSFDITGDDVVYNSRPVTTATFVFPINGIDNKEYDVIIAADKRFTKLDLPISFCTSNYFIHTNNKTTLLTGLLIGGCFFLFLYTFYLFITIKQFLYLWYSIFLFLIIIYIAADAGILFKYLFPTYTGFNDIIRPSILALIEFPLMLFFIHLLGIKKNFPKIFFYNKLLLISYLILFTIAMFTVKYGSFESHGFWLKAINIVGPLLILFTLFQSIYFVVKKVKFSIFAFLSYSSFSFFIVLFSLQQREVIVSNIFTQYANYWSIFFEAILVAFVLAWRYKLYKQDSETLLKENLEQQELIFKETATWQEKEMQRISSLLHDTVGANLGFLRLATDNMPLTQEGKNKIAAHITQLGNEVRNMSHSFSPIVLQDKGLYVAVEELVKSIRNNSLINLQFEWLGNKKEINLQYQIIIYRIVQELMQNMIKHAKATNAFLQIIVEENLVSIYVEDDGIGMKANSNKGIGLRSIENLVNLLKGNFRIESSETDGFNISIEFKTRENEQL